MAAENYPTCAAARGHSPPKEVLRATMLHVSGQIRSALLRGGQGFDQPERADDKDDRGRAETVVQPIALQPTAARQIVMSIMLPSLVSPGGRNRSRAICSKEASKSSPP